MKPDNFEQQLRRQPVRRIPEEWRDDLLNAAKAAAREGANTGAVGHWLRAIFWPNPAAWAGLAAVWLGIFVLNSLSTEPTFVRAGEPVSGPGEAFMALRLEHEELARLTEPVEAQPAERPKVSPPRPRGDLKSQISLV